MNQAHPKAIASVSEVIDLLHCVVEQPEADDGVTAWLIHNFLLGPDGIISKPVTLPVQAPASRRVVALTSGEFTRALENARRADDSWPWLDSQKWLLDHARSQDGEILLSMEGQEHGNDR